jgi:hypothetical protein
VKARGIIEFMQTLIQVVKAGVPEGEPAFAQCVEPYFVKR